MSKSMKVLLVGLLALCGCSGESNPISTKTTQPSFVIDELSVTGSVKLYTLTTSPATFISMNAVYHFEGQPGLVDGFSLSTSHQTQTAINYRALTHIPTQKVSHTRTYIFRQQ
jgi:hypothetical protein